MTALARIVLEHAPVSTVLDAAGYPPSLRAAVEAFARSGGAVAGKALFPHPRLASRWVVVPAGGE